MTGHIKHPMPLIKKRRGLSPGGRFPPSFIHQVIIITELKKLYDCMSHPEDGLRCRLGIKKTHSNSCMILYDKVVSVSVDIAMVLV